ncbi:hypothetical protein SMMN14_08085 [Sphaerulina musiva]
MQFKNILAAGAGLAATSVSAAVARDDAAVIVHEVVTYSPSVVYSTRVQTVTECRADVTDCPDITGVLTSVIDSTTTICPVTATAIMSTSGVPNPSNSGPLQTVTITFTNSSTAWASTETAPAQASSVALSGWSSSGAPSSSKQPGATLASPEEASKTETASAAKSTSFVYATITLPATASSSTSGPSSSASGPSSSASGPSSSASGPSSSASGPSSSASGPSSSASGPSSSANSTVPITTAASTFSTNAVGPVGGTGAASGTFSYSANGTLATATTPAVSESIVPFLGAAAHDVGSPLLVLAMLAAYPFLV